MRLTTRRSRQPLRRADLHVHTHHSEEVLRYGRLVAPFAAAASPTTIATRALDAGMDYIAITDHDTLDGCHRLLDQRPELEPKLIVGEEVTCRVPDSGHELHVSVLGIDARKHDEIQARRTDLPRLVGYLRRERILYVLNHPIWDAEGRRWTPARLAELIRLIRDHFPVLEGRNGSMLPYQNKISSRIARRLGCFVVGGSDTHTDQVGYTWTEAPGEDKAAYLEAIRAGQGRPAGRQCTPRFFSHEVGQLLRANGHRRAKPLGRLTGLLLLLLMDTFHARLTRLATRAYLRAMQGMLPGAARHLEGLLPRRGVGDSASPAAW